MGSRPGVPHPHIGSPRSPETRRRISESLAETLPGGAGSGDGGGHQPGQDRRVRNLMEIANAPTPPAHPGRPAPRTPGARVLTGHESVSLNPGGSSHPAPRPAAPAPARQQTPARPAARPAPAPATPAARPARPAGAPRRAPSAAPAPSNTRRPAARPAARPAPTPAPARRQPRPSAPAPAPATPAATQAVRQPTSAQRREAGILRMASSRGVPVDRMTRDRINAMSPQHREALRQELANGPGRDAPAGHTWTDDNRLVSTRGRGRASGSTSGQTPGAGRQARGSGRQATPRPTPANAPSANPPASANRIRFRNGRPIGPASQLGSAADQHAARRHAANAPGPDATPRRRATDTAPAGSHSSQSRDGLTDRERQQRQQMEDTRRRTQAAEQGLNQSTRQIAHPVRTRLQQIEAQARRDAQTRLQAREAKSKLTPMLKALQQGWKAGGGKIPGQQIVAKVIPGHGKRG